MASRTSVPRVLSICASLTLPRRPRLFSTASARTLGTSPPIDNTSILTVARKLKPVATSVRTSHTCSIPKHNSTMVNLMSDTEDLVDFSSKECENEDQPEVVECKEIQIPVPWGHLAGIYHKKALVFNL